MLFLQPQSYGFQPGALLEVNRSSPYSEGLRQLIVFATGSPYAFDLVTRRPWRPMNNNVLSVNEIELSVARGGAGGRPKASASFARRYWEPTDAVPSGSSGEFSTQFCFFEYDSGNDSGAVFESIGNNRVIRIDPATRFIRCYYASGDRATSTVAVPNDKPTTFMVVSKGGEYFFGIDGRYWERFTSLDFGTWGGILRIGGSEAHNQGSTRAKYYLVAEWYRRFFLPTEYLDLHRNPWQLTRPRSSTQRFFGKAASGGGTFTYTPSGGIAFAGAAALQKDKIGAVSGGYAFGGTAGILRQFNPSISGGYTFAGAGTTVKSKIGAVSGGLVFDGAAVIEKSKIGTVSGGYVFGGGATYSAELIGATTYTYTPSGGYSFAGSGTIAKGKISDVSGGIQFGGAASAQFTSGVISTVGGIVPYPRRRRR